MPIPNKLAVTFCQSCETQISENQLCMPGCQWDGTTNVRERPVLVVTYWNRDGMTLDPPLPTRQEATSCGDA